MLQEGTLARLELSVLLDHFNWRIAQWEPVMEQCAVVVEAMQNVNNQLSLRVRMDKRLEIVISDDAINALHGALFRIQEAFTAPLEVLVAGRSRPPYAISNETGVEVRFCKVNCLGRSLPHAAVRSANKSTDH